MYFLSIKQLSQIFVLVVILVNFVSGQNVGIGITTPQTRFHLVNGNTIGSMSFPYETFVAERNTDIKLGIFNSNTNIAGSVNGGAAVIFGYNNAVDNNSRYPGAELQYGSFSLSQYFLRFNFLRRSQLGVVHTPSSYQNSVIFSDNGRVGINLTNGAITPILPSANLDVNGTVKFQNLPSSTTGNYLVIDGSGNIYRSNIVLGRPAISSDIEALEKKISNLEFEIEQLKLLLNQSNIK
ncbi:hypothetical protein ACQ33O_11580 [Ferruginibacter sp. SUN002]|uniref:hypothetical protein n=1 Tax=Ferruginibacter sp. SUN002 TaxID=2937789 RepID=UPI003D35F192